MLVLTLVSPFLQCLAEEVGFSITLKKTNSHKSLVIQFVDLSSHNM